MMWGSIVLLSLLCVVTIGWELQGLSSLTVPVFMWSDKLAFTTPQVTDTVTSSDISIVFSSLISKPSNKDSKFNILADNSIAPEVIVLFVEPELKTDQVPYLASAYSANLNGGSFSHLKTAMNAAASSLVMPYATVNDVTLLDEALLDTFESIDGSIFMSSLSGSTLFPRLRQLDTVVNVDVGSLIEELTAKQVFNNGVTDFVVVCFDKATDGAFVQHDSLIGSISESIRVSSNGKYVAMYTANMPTAKQLTWTFNEHATAESQYNINLYMDNTTNTTNTTTHINYFPGPFIEVLMVSSVLLTMLFTGACAIFSIQTPDRWETPRIRKEHQH